MNVDEYKMHSAFITIIIKISINIHFIFKISVIFKISHILFNI
jgi:hypothetical protein